MSAGNVDEVLDRAQAQFGDTAYFQIRYTYDIVSTDYNTWHVRPYTLGASGRQTLPNAPPATAPVLDVPYSAPPTGPFSATLSPVADAEYYRPWLVYRRGSPAGTDMGVYNGESEVREFGTGAMIFDVVPPAHTMMVVRVVSACNAAG